MKFSYKTFSKAVITLKKGGQKTDRKRTERKRKPTLGRVSFRRLRTLETPLRNVRHKKQTEKAFPFR